MKKRNFVNIINVKNTICMVLIIATCMSLQPLIGANSKSDNICFGVNHPRIGNVSSANTTGKTSYINNMLSLVGYHNRGHFINNRASVILNNLGHKAVIYLSGHGNKGRYVTSYHNGTQWVLEDITANDVPNKHSLHKSFANTTYKLNHAKLVYFSSCYSAATDATNGNLVDKAISLGAEASIGFEKVIMMGPSETFDRIFFEEAIFHRLSMAVFIAQLRTSINWPLIYDFSGVDSCVIKGDKSIRLFPGI